MRLLRSPEIDDPAAGPVPGGTNPGDLVPPGPIPPAPVLPPGPSVPAPAHPPAAAIVIAGTKTVPELEAELADERASHARTADEKKDREIRISELEDELFRLRKIQSQPPAPPRPAPKEPGFTLLHEIEDD